MVCRKVVERSNVMVHRGGMGGATGTEVWNRRLREGWDVSINDGFDSIKGNVVGGSSAFACGVGPCVARLTGLMGLVVSMDRVVDGVRWSCDATERACCAGCQRGSRRGRNGSHDGAHNRWMALPLVLMAQVK
eukprot:364990-Chlamydomonas_euryale.AAC.9